jgi:NADH:ubiquinone oxidoreductase subunit F (NADH-binding)/(2Fe-2S) ferredoxin/NAD-dependent dihydropyrimidine dehydrogenase PreA subunit
MITLQQLDAIWEQARENMQAKQGLRIAVGMASCGISAGALPVYETLQKEIEKRGLKDARLVLTGCIGMCTYEPIVEVCSPDHGKISYINMTAEKAVKVAAEHLQGGKPVAAYTIHDDLETLEDLKFYQKQHRIVLQNCGRINPEDIREYIAYDGYQALAKCLLQMTPAQVVEVVKQSGLRGRGGAGFPTGLKWSLAAANAADQKYFICNADEGDPGAFMDRSILEGDPHAVLEAMAIGGYAIGASKGFVYVRAEYPVAVKRLQIAIDQAKDLGVLGEHIFGSGFSFDIELRLGAGAFVCGEETALIASIEGKRGMPRNKPPFPAQAGLWGRPTIINNVETLANVAQIINKGAEWFRSFGTEKSPGTKAFALGGKINNTGLVEVPMGITLREIVYEIGGGCPNHKAFKAVQTGGPSGGCITAEHLDVPIDFDNLVAIGSMMGSGGMIVMDEDNCMVDIARFFLDFTVDESCGKCTPCREGTKRMPEILEKITGGKGQPEDLEKLNNLAGNISRTSLCSLGATAPNPILSTMRYFWDEYQAHVIDHRCPAHVCRALLRPYITENCRGCTQCAKNCPVAAISGKAKERYSIDQDKCVNCGACLKTCKFNAIIRK